MTHNVGFYLQNGREMNEIKSDLRDDEIPEELIEKMAEALYGYFYQVKFEVLFDARGNIIRVCLIPKLDLEEEVCKFCGAAMQVESTGHFGTNLICVNGHYRKTI